MSLTPDQSEYHQFVAEMITEEQPRLFAVLREFGEYEDAEIAAWGLAWEDHIEVIGPHGVRLSSDSAERVVRRFSRGDDSSARLVWLGREP
ncbi:hypothetical protein ABZ816_35040 [Actinosynnema sp. NPDC047251]|uniref:Uncharacterized protein n=1 Tax=Saccharothrix espanaensis (strain ATCC 51144 / DSM 44229 / JCM 9112 / NBRC 15066 / NRRL 15764) TaxID=1179773 RepID=K0JUZ3_SACES|nr:hypothetical protein [Saccharothrix espanaensis]CCH28579.1 hypothetical protein BN6_12530 [Saccharothrix espanaensis DSM 44229]